MRNRTAFVVTAAAILVFGLNTFADQHDSTIPYPKGFRQWAHVKTSILSPSHGVFAKEPCEKPCSGGLFHFYANQKALEGYRTGKFPDGAIIADEFLETRTQDQATSEGPRRGVGLMVKDSKLYRETGGWGFETFKGDSQTEGRLTAEASKACFACHVSKKDSDFVFTKYRE